MECLGDFCNLLKHCLCAFGFRANVAWYNLIGDFLNILKAFIGTNYQALPFAFHNSGLVFGIIGLFVIATLTDHCIHLLVKSKYRVIEIACNEERDAGAAEHDVMMLRKRLERTVGYGDVAKKAYGRWCYVLTQFLVWFTQYATCISYFIFIGNTVIEIFPLKIYHHNETLNDSLAIHDQERVREGIPMLALEKVIRGKRQADYSLYLDGFQDIPLLIYDNISSLLDNTTNSLFNVSSTTVMSTTSDALWNGTSTMSSDNLTTAIMDTTTVTAPFRPITINTAPDLRFVMMFPVPFFILTSLLRRLRFLSPLSSLASLALFVGALCVVVFLAHDFQVAEEVHLFKLATLPLFLGQVISAYEGIGCLIPIHSSMEGNRHLFPAFLHANVYIVFAILCTFGSLGYLRYGEGVSQIIVENIKQHSVKSTFVDVTLIISVLFTYPLQCFPVIEIMETYIFGSGRICGPPLEHRLEYDEIGNGTSVQDQDTRGILTSQSADIEFHASQVSIIVPQTVPAYRRNILRVLITLSVMGIAILMRNSYAYLNVFSGAVGCSALSFILPCVIHIKLCNPSKAHLVKDITIVSLAVLSSLLAVGQVLYYLATGKAGTG